MKKENIFTLSNVIFLLLFAFSLFFNGLWRLLFYFSAFFVASVFGLWRAPDGTDTIAPLRLANTERTRLAFALIPPIIALTMLSALAFGAIFSLFGIQSTTALSASFGTALIRHALLPAIFEELLFRYLPLVLLGRENPKGLILASAMFFALGHVSVVHLPYAFLAGVCYMALALVTGSVWPCVLAHFCNNLLSLLFTFFPAAATAVLVAFLLLTLACIALILSRRRAYAEVLSPLLRGRSHEYLTRFPILYAAFVLLVSAMQL